MQNTGGTMKNENWIVLKSKNKPILIINMIFCVFPVVNNAPTRPIFLKVQNMWILMVKNVQVAKKTHQNDLYHQITYEKGFHSPVDIKSIRPLFWLSGPKNAFSEKWIFQKYENYGYSRSRDFFQKNIAAYSTLLRWFCFFNQVSTMDVAVFMIKTLNLYFCDLTERMSV